MRALLTVAIATLLVTAAACGGSTTTPPDGGTDMSTPACTSAAQCDDHLFCNGVETCSPGAAGADARGCLVASSGPCTAGQVCDEPSMRCAACTAAMEDVDTDGHRATACGGDDCDDADPNRYPGNTEVCDAANHDEDCDDLTFGFRDADTDGYADARCCNGTHCGMDCNDVSQVSHPGAPETCDGLDNDCNGTADDGVLHTYYTDADADSYGDVADATGVTGCFAPAGRAEMHGDCNDANGAVHPGAYDACDAAGVDDDCDGIPNNPATGCTCIDGMTQPCPLHGVCAAGTQTCVGGAWSTMCSIVPTAETCNGLDDDCNDVVDDGMRVSCFVDGDDDSYAGAGAMSATHCPVGGRVGVGGCPTGWTNRAPAGSDIDCNDTRSDVYPTHVEACDGADNNCNGTVDEGVATTCYADADADGYAASGATSRSSCTGCATTETTRAPTAGNTDCNDTAASGATIHPGATETCNGVDDNCDGVGTNEDADGDHHTRTGYTSCTGGYPIDDCHDGNGSVHPGVTSWFTSGFCPSGEASCGTGCCMVTSACLMGVPPIADRCSSGGLLPRSFDYNCASGNEPQPPPTLPCASACSGGASCGMVGPTAAHAASECGTNVGYTHCRGLAVGPCTAPPYILCSGSDTTDTELLGCH